MKTSTRPIRRDPSTGELVIPNLNSHITTKYRPDTPLDNAIVPYLVMLLCAAADCLVFVNLFSKVSWDRPSLIAVQVAGFLMAFDVVPIYIGIQYRRVKQKLTNNKFILWMAVGVFTFAVILNIVLRVLTMDLMSGSTSTSYFGTVTEQMTTSTSANDPATIAQTLFCSVIPILTSLTSFYISYLTSDPQRFKKKNYEKLISEKSDEIRSLNAYLSEFDADSDFAQHLEEDDNDKYISMQKFYKALVLTYAGYVRQRLKEHIGNPTSTNILSEENAAEILERLDRELAALDSSVEPHKDGKPGWHTAEPDNNLTPITTHTAA